MPAPARPVQIRAHHRIDVCTDINEQIYVFYFNRFIRFSIVEFEKDVAKFKKLQTKKHGGWSDKMELACGIRGIVNKVKSGSVYVEGVNGDEYVNEYSV